MHAFVRIETLQDLSDAIALLKRGAVLGIEPVPGNLFGPSRPCAIGDKANRGLLRLNTIDLGDFLMAYMSDRGWFERLHVPESADPEIHEAWGILNHAAGSWLTPLQIVRIVELLARRYGGVVEPQIGYGADGWVELVKAGGIAVCWGKPSLAELGDIATYARGIVCAEAGMPWFAGISGPYQMPNRGLIRWESGMPPADAYVASGRPTGLGPAWDSVAGFYRLVGIVVPSTATEEERKAAGWAAVVKTERRNSPRSQDVPVRPVRQIPRTVAPGWLDSMWGEFVRVDFT